ncbi:MAG: nuclear transport factor 2 family protein [Gemmatimonadota bacterium]
MSVVSPPLGRVFLVFALTFAPATLVAQSPEQRAVVAIVEAFHDALGRGDSTAALRLLAPGALILEAGGLESRDEYRAHHLPGDIAFARSVSSRRDEPEVIVAGDVAWVVGTSRSSGMFGDRAVNSANAELVVLSRSGEGWRIRAIHWSSRTIRTP